MTFSNFQTNSFVENVINERYLPVNKSSPKRQRKIGRVIDTFINCTKFFSNFTIEDDVKNPQHRRTRKSDTDRARKVW